MNESPNCYYCGDVTEPSIPLLPKGFMNPNFRTRDHVIPRRYRQTGESVPIVVACAWCNGTKGEKTVESWINWLRRRSEGASLPAMWESGRYKAAKVVQRWEDGRIKRFVPRPKPHLVRRQRNGLFVCTCGTLSAKPCQIAAI